MVQRGTDVFGIWLNSTLANIIVLTTRAAIAGRAATPRFGVIFAVNSDAG